MTARRAATIRELERRLGYQFAEVDWLERALTHPSANDGRSKTKRINYQRLEFLGDRVLALAVSDMLFAAFPEADEGELARRLTALVRNETCADVARELDLGKAIRLGAGEARSGGRRKAAILGDVCEAVIGAIHKDGGTTASEAFVNRLWRPRMLAYSGPLRDAKTTLQEWAQGRGLETPEYRLADRGGPDHAPRFRVEVVIGGLKPTLGEGGTKREAEQRAAAAFLVREGVWSGEQADG